MGGCSGCGPCRGAHQSWPAQVSPLAIGGLLMAALILPVWPINSSMFRLAAEHQHQISKRRSAGLNWRRRSPPSTRRCQPSSGTDGHHYRQLWRGRGHRPLRSGPWAAAGDQRGQHLLAARLRRSAAAGADRDRLLRPWMPTGSSPTAAWPARSPTPTASTTRNRTCPDIFLCGPPRRPWPAFWRSFQSLRLRKNHPAQI